MAEVDCKFGKLQSSAQPIRDPLVAQAIREMDIGTLTDSLYKTNMLEDFMSAYDAWIRSSTLNRINGLEDYDKFMTFAVTHAIEQFLMKHRHNRIRTFEGEYPGTMELIKGYGLAHAYLESDSIASGDAVVMSSPFSGNGNQHPRMDAVLELCNELQVPVMVDCAFFGICKGINIGYHQCIETIAFSLSKCYCMHNYRIGMIYSRNPPAGIEVLQRFGYTSRFGAAIAMGLFDRFGPDHAYLKYSGTQSDICKELGDMTPSDTILFGNGGRTWSKFDRGGGNNRVSFGAFMPEVRLGMIDV